MKFKIGPLLVILSFVTTSHAADFIVVTNSDSGPGSLRQAILDANAAGGGTITFSNAGGLILLSNQLPALSSSIKVSGPGPERLAIQGPAIFTNVLGNYAIVSDLTITNSRSAIVNLGSLTLSNCAIVNGSSGSPDVPSYLAPGIYNAGTLAASYCTLSGNYTFLDKEGTAIHNSGTMSLAHCTITNNSISFGTGCGIFNSGDLTADYCSIDHNSGHDCDGSGIHNAAGSVILRNCSVNYNGAFGAGGILNDASLAMTNCTLAGNAAYYSDGPQPGGGMMNHGYAALQNTTVSGNRATPGGIGAGIWNDGTIDLLNTTIVSNSVGRSDCYDPSSGAGVWNSGTVRSRNSIIAGNFGVYLPCPLQGVDFWGNLDSLGHNLIQNSSGWTNVGTGTGDLVGLDPMIGPFQDNGGPTWTHALLPGSSAIDAGDSTVWYAPPEDQRGVPRPQGPRVDIGAFEYQYSGAVFTRIEVQANTNLLLKGFALPGTSYTLQASQDFLSWNTIATLTSASNGVLQFTSSMPGPKRFFRFRSQ